MAKKTNCCAQKDQTRLNKVGGQAVIEGVMMKAGERTVTTCRKEDKSLVVYDDKFVSIRKKLKFLNIPLLRGFVNFIEMMKLSMKTLSNSADALGIEEEESRFEKWLKKHLGFGIVAVIMTISVVLAVALALGLFMFLPIFVSGLIDTYAFDGGLGIWWSSAIEGVMKITIFVLYLWGVSLIPDIKRTFMYHGAEHKSIACFESGTELSPENAKNYTRFHPRCGTSFMFVMILIGIFAGVFVRGIWPGLTRLEYGAIRLLMLPLVMGVGYEFIMFAGKHDNFVTRALSAPGLWMQKITTKEPTEDMLEVAIISIKCALRDDFPEFKEFYEAKSWEKKEEVTQPDSQEAESVSKADESVKAEESSKSDENEAIEGN